MEIMYKIGKILASIFTIGCSCLVIWSGWGFDPIVSVAGIVMLFFSIILLGEPL